MEEKEEQTEYGASPFGLECLWWIYRLFGRCVLRFFAQVVGLTIWLFSAKVRRNSPRLAKILAFTRSLADKFIIMANGRKFPPVVLDDHPDVQEFDHLVRNKKGVFILFSHIGTIEALSVLKGFDQTFHAWTEFSRTGVFNAFYFKHANRERLQIHPIEEFGPETVFWAGDALDRGEGLIMAGDRGIGRKQTVIVEGRELHFPIGAFRFAHLLEHPIFFCACLEQKDGSYQVFLRRLPTDNKEMVNAFAQYYVQLANAYPDQVFQWQKES